MVRGKLWKGSLLAGVGGSEPFLRPKLQVLPAGSALYSGPQSTWLFLGVVCYAGGFGSGPTGPTYGSVASVG